MTDLDGHHIIDYWQGHYANILGHNPPEITSKLAAALQEGYGLQTGHIEEAEAQFAEILAHATHTERVRLTTSGTLATMYALMIARAYTGRPLVLKIGGGWHGANPFALKGVARTPNGYQQVDSAGIPSSLDEEICVTRFNDVEALERFFAKKGDRLAAFIFEPCPSKAGFTPATREYMQAARRLTAHYGALLILDEVITGFRYCAGSIQRLYGIQADLTTFGKVIGGGMPIAAVAGRADLMALISEKAQPRVWFNGGTYSAHPLSLLAGLTMLRYLIDNHAHIYPTLAAKGEKLRQGIERIFADRGILARCTGQGGDVIEASSLLGVCFPLDENSSAYSPDDLYDPTRYDVTLSEQVLKIGMLLQGINVIHGLGALSLAHTDQDLERTLEAFDAVAQRIQRGR